MGQLKYFFIILSILILVPTISAAPPIQTNLNIEQGLEIQIPPINTLKQNAPFEFQFHVFNKSDGLMVSNDTTTCKFHLYNRTGGEVIGVDLGMAANLIDWQITVTEDNFSNIGFMAYIVQCNTTSLGGFMGVPLEITETGESEDTSFFVREGLKLFLIFILVSLSVTFYILSFQREGIIGEIIYKFISAAFSVIVAIYLATDGLPIIANTFLRDSLIVIITSFALYVLAETLFAYGGGRR